MLVINNSSVVVYDDNELKDILEKDNDYTYIYFGADITLTTGIKINKNSVILDGTYNNVMHTFTDQKKLGTSDGLYITSNAEVYIKNMSITGYNYYGIVYVPNSSNFINTVIEYNNVTYTGCQLSYNRRGILRIIDSDINIQDSYASGNEVAECNRVEIGGNTIITHKSTGNSSFWFLNDNPSLTILNDSNVNFTSISRELFYGTNNLKLTVSKGAIFTITTKSGMGYNTYGTGEVLIDEGASLVINQMMRNGNNPTWYSYGIITINKGSLSIINSYDNISSANYCIYFIGNSAGLILNDPLKVVLYNLGANIINTQNKAVFDFTFTRLNLFNNTITINENISQDNLPDYSWYKDELSSITGTFNNTQTIINTTNYTEEELTNLPSLDNFNFVNKKILSIGSFSFHVNAITDTDTSLSGITTAYASILIEYNNVFDVIQASEDGFFNYVYSNPLNEGDVITFQVKMYNDLLYVTKKATIVYSGELVIDEVTKYLSFEPFIINDELRLCPRLTSLEIKVIDSRINSTDWKLYASIDHDLQSSDGKTLVSSLVYLENDNLTVLSKEPKLVYIGEHNGGNLLVTYVSWDEEQGILLQINSPLENNTEYFSQITWTLEE